MPFSSFVLQMLIILLLIHQICVTTGIMHTVSLPVLLLSATENLIGTFITPGQRVGEFHASQPFAVPSY